MNLFSISFSRSLKNRGGLVVTGAEEPVRLLSSKSPEQAHRVGQALVRRWRSLTLAQQFVLASSTVVLVALGSLGLGLSNEIAHELRGHVGATALYMERIIAAHLQGLEPNQPIPPETAKAIDLTISRDAPRLGVIVAKIWSPNGHLLYASDHKSVGVWFTPTQPLRRALQGNIQVEFESPPADHGAPSGEFMEIYVPILDSTNGALLAVGEFYADRNFVANSLFKNDPFDVPFENWLLVAFVSLSTVAGLYALVARGSKTIEAQRVSLAERIQLLSDLLTQNESLRQRAQDASRRVAEDVELHLSRLGADLHDGPAQLLALGLLKLDSLDTLPGDRATLRSLLSDAMSEIREISGGLALPEIRDLSLEASIQLIVAGHERRTGTLVKASLSNFPLELKLSHPVKLCLCRFVQEGLNNAFKHASGFDQRVTATWSGEMIVVEVSDGGPGFDTSVRRHGFSGLGLIGLRSRLESLGGNMTVKSEPGMGTRITAYLSP